LLFSLPNLCCMLWLHHVIFQIMVLEGSLGPGKQKARQRALWLENYLETHLRVAAGRGQEGISDTDDHAVKELWNCGVPLCNAQPTRRTLHRQ
jgi:hypothetical protein